MVGSSVLSSVVLPTCFTSEAEGPPVRAKGPCSASGQVLTSLLGLPGWVLAVSMFACCGHLPTNSSAQHTNSFYIGCCTPVEWQ